MNYYIALSTAVELVKNAGVHPAFSAAVIGAANVGALVVALLHSSAMSKENELGDEAFGFGFFRRNFLFYTILPIIGNVLDPIAVSCASVPLAVFGRVLVGFGSADLLHRQFLASCLPAPHLVVEAARLVNSQLQGVVLGLVVGGISSLYNVNVRVTTISSLHTGSYLMAALWFTHCMLLLFFFQESPRVNSEDTDDSEEIEGEDEELAGKLGDESNDASDGSSEDGTGTPDSIFYRSSSDVTRDEVKTPYANVLKATFGKAAGLESAVYMPATTEESDQTNRKRPMTLKRRLRKLRSFFARVRKALGDNVAIPVTLTVIVFVVISHEILFTSCPLITDMYFHWKGGHVSLLLGVLSVMVFPLYYVGEKISRRFDERTIIKVSGSSRLHILFCFMLTQQRDRCSWLLLGFW